MAGAHDYGLGDPRLAWRDPATPVSERFGDVYFSAGAGEAESRHVFLEGCRLPSAWASRETFTVGETGFGTGLNFLLTWDLWRRDPARSERLTYVSVEGYPLARGGLRQCLAPFAGLRGLAAQLTEAWPEPHPGFHLRTFEDGRVRLLLLLGPVETMLARLSVQVDAWFLDGFAPSRNPEMWAPTVLEAVARRTAAGGRLATFTAAGAVRRGLEAVGFQVERRPGFGRKRECTIAVYRGPGPARVEAPWFLRPAPVPRGATVAIVGGGIAGCAAAAALRRAGYAPRIIDRAGRLGAEASGNPCGLLKPRLTADGGLHGRFYGLAYLHAVAALDALDAEGALVWLNRGLLSLARNPDEACAMKRLTHTLPPAHVAFVEAREARALTGIEAPFGGLWFPRAGSIAPPAVCAALADGVPVQAATVERLERVGDGWRLYDPEGRTVTTASAVVLAAGPWVPKLWPRAELPIHANRGQITLLPPRRSAPSVALSFGGYLSPAVATGGAGRHVLGATYERIGDPDSPHWRAVRDADHARNLDGLAAHASGLRRLWDDAAPVGGRSALRATVADHLPVLGPLFDSNAWRTAYATLHHGRPWNRYPPAPLAEGLYVMGGLGSRGFQTTPLLAETLVALLDGGALPLERDLWEAIHPARFLLRHLRRPPDHRNED